MAIVTQLYVDPDEGDGYTVEVPMRAVMKWEQLFPGRSLADLTARGNLSAHEMYELAYVTLKRDKKPVPEKFQDFVEVNEVSSMRFVQANGVAATDEAEAEPAPDPTPQDQSTEP